MTKIRVLLAMLCGVAIVSVPGAVTQAAGSASLTGYVRDGNGMGMADAQIVVSRGNDESYATTDDTGRYEIDGLSQGTWKLSGYPSSTAFDTIAPDREKVILKNGTTENVDFVAQLGGRIRVRIVNSKGETVPGSQVDAVLPGPAGSSIMSWIAMDPEPDGTFVLRGNSPARLMRTGSYAVQVHPPSSYVVPKEAIVKVTYGQVAEVTVVVTPAAVVTGKVVDSRGRPLAGIWLQANQGESGFSLKTGKTGKFRVVTDTFSPVGVFFLDDSLVHVSRKVAVRPISGRTVSMGSIKLATPGSVTIPALNMHGKKPAKVDAEVYRIEGKKTIQIYGGPKPSDRVWNGSHPPFNAVMSQGKVKVTGLPAGTYKFAVRTRNVADSWSYYGSSKSLAKATKVTVKAGRSKQLKAVKLGRSVATKIKIAGIKTTSRGRRVVISFKVTAKNGAYPDGLLAFDVFSPNGYFEQIEKPLNKKDKGRFSVTLKSLDRGKYDVGASFRGGPKYQNARAVPKLFTVK